MKFGDLTAFNGSTVLHSIADCVATTCHNASLATCSKDTVEPLSDFRSAEDLTFQERLSLLYLGVSTYCDNACTGSEPNIAGPGVRMGNGYCS